MIDKFSKYSLINLKREVRSAGFEPAIPSLYCNLQIPKLKDENPRSHSSPYVTTESRTFASASILLYMYERAKILYRICIVTFFISNYNKGIRYSLSPKHFVVLIYVQSLHLKLVDLIIILYFLLMRISFS